MVHLRRTLTRALPNQHRLQHRRQRRRGLQLVVRCLECLSGRMTNRKRERCRAAAVEGRRCSCRVAGSSSHRLTIVRSTRPLHLHLLAPQAMRERQQIASSSSVTMAATVASRSRHRSATALTRSQRAPRRLATTLHQLALEAMTFSVKTIHSLRRRCRRRLR